MIGAFNLQQWVEENRELLKPPVGNKNLYPLSEDYIIMVVGGPNARKDFHYNESEEFFFQLEGSIYVDIQVERERKRITLNPGDMFLLPAKVPHSPVRSENSIGLVVEKKRKATEVKDGLLWYCENCNEKLYETYFELTNIEIDFLPRFKHFYNSIALRTCKSCGTVMYADEKLL